MSNVRRSIGFSIVVLLSVVIPIGVIAWPGHASEFVDRNEESPVFVYEGELTAIVEDQESNSRLVHLREGRWVDGRKIRHPPLNVDWYENPVDGRKMFQPANPRVFGYYPSKMVAPTGVVPLVTNTIVGLAPHLGNEESPSQAARTERHPETNALLRSGGSRVLAIECLSGVVQRPRGPILLDTIGEHLGSNPVYCF